MSGNVRNLRDSFLHFVADNLPAASVHPLRFDSARPQYNSLQIGRINIAFHDATYSTMYPTCQFATLDILHTAELDALDLEESLVALLQLGGSTELTDYSGSTPVQVSNSLIYWNPLQIKFRTVASVDYFHRSAVIELWTRYINVNPLPRPLFLNGASGVTTFDTTLTGNINVNLQSLSTGELYTFIWAQDNIGGHTVTLPSSMKGATPPSLTPNAVTVQTFLQRSDGTLDAIGPATYN